MNCFSYRLLYLFLFFSSPCIAMEQRRFISLAPEQCFELIRQRCVAERAECGDSLTGRRVAVFFQDCKAGKNVELVLEDFQPQNNSPVRCNIHLKSQDIMEALQAGLSRSSLEEKP